MHSTTRRLFAIFGGAVAFAGLLGGTLGIAAAQNSLPAGPAYIGGPRESMSPENFTSCLPTQSWNSIYVWDASTQQWKHWINPAKGVPEWVNAPDVGGIEMIPRFSGLAILVDTAIPNATFPQINAQACND